MLDATARLPLAAGTPFQDFPLPRTPDKMLPAI
jgi:hypothetical protein